MEIVYNARTYLCQTVDDLFGRLRVLLQLAEVVDGGDEGVVGTAVLAEVGDEGLGRLVELVLGRAVVAETELGHEVERLVEVLLPQHLEADEVVVVVPLDRPL